MIDKPLCFVIPTYRLREVGETVAQYDDHFWRNAHSNLHKAFYGFEPDFFQHNLLRIVDEAVHVIKGSIELWPTLIEICYFQKGTMSVVERLFKDLAAGFRHLLKWFVHEFLLPTTPAAGSRLASVCRVIGCGVIVASLRVELRDGLLPSTVAAVIQLGLAGLTALLFGNVAKEFAFDLAARFTVLCGRAFVRTGLTVRGNPFWETQFTDGTWMRCETNSTQAICEWTEPDGRCNRLEVRAIAPSLPAAVVAR